MSPIGELASGYWPLFDQVLSELDFDTIDPRATAREVIKIGRNSKETNEFGLRLNEHGIQLSSKASQLLERIHRIFPPNPDPNVDLSSSVTRTKRQNDIEIKIEVIQQDPDFLREQTKRYCSDVDHHQIRPQDSELNSAAMNHRALIDDHRLVLGHIQSRRTLMAHSIPPSELSIRTLSNEDRARFPIFKFKKQIISSLRGHGRALIVVGETGSGKTTQIPQYLAEAGFASDGLLIGCSQPHHAASESAAKMVPNKTITFMDESSLCNELIADQSLSKYSVIMIDDAHQRSVTTDLLFGLIKNVLRVRVNDFRLVVTSANSDEIEGFSNYFFGCDTLVVPPPSRNHLQVRILPADKLIMDPLAEALGIVLNRRKKEPPGDILLFLSGENEVDFALRILFDHSQDPNLDLPPLIVFTACSTLRSEIDPRVFQQTPRGAIKVVVATSAAEFSLAGIRDIVCVIDPGLTERRSIDSVLANSSIEITPISRASANRRAMLAGFTDKPIDCVCHRLYSEAAFSNVMKPTAEPDIQTACLSTAALRMMASGIDNIWNFEFLGPPPPTHVAKALRQMYCLEALDENGYLTETGRKMALFPLDPTWSRALLAGVEFGCVDDVLTMVAMAQTEGILFPPWENQAIAYYNRHRFFRVGGDLLSLIFLYKAWEDNKFSKQWSDKNFVPFEYLRKAKHLRNRLAGILEQMKLRRVESPGQKEVKMRKAITSGLFFHAARRDSIEGYRTLVGDHRVYIPPQNDRFKVAPSWVVYNKLVKNNGRDFMFGIVVIEPKWLSTLAPRFFREQQE